VITVTPEEFTLVDFDHAELLALVTEVATTIGHDPAVDITVEVDQDIPLIGTQLRSIDPVDLYIEGGAMEDPKRIRQFHASGARVVVGRLLMMAMDRRSEEFGPVPGNEDIELPLSTAWNTYVVGRLARLGFPSQRQRRLYTFRNRHGFTDAADAAFDKLWNSESLTWAEVAAISESAAS